MLYLHYACPTDGEYDSVAKYEEYLGVFAVAGRVIQGFFLGGRVPPASASRITAPIAATAGAPPLGRNGAVAQCRSGHPVPGPPAPAFANRTAAVQPKVAPGRPALVQPGDRRHVQASGGSGGFAIDPAQVGLVRQGGKRLPATLLAKMEAAFGADFSAVRVHVGPQASRIGAIAFATGNDLYFAPGQYQPESRSGQQLIGHELAHVIQQRQGRVRASGAGVAVVQDQTLEAEADRMGARAASHRIVEPRRTTVSVAPLSKSIQRAQAVVAPVLRVHRVRRSVTPEIHEFTRAAIEAGAPTLLTYVANKVSNTYVRDRRNQLIITMASVDDDQEMEGDGLPRYDFVSIRDVARAKVFNLGAQLAGATRAYQYNYSRDEYPYASTLECGTDAFWAYAPVAEQNSQGGSLRGLYQHLNDGDQFRVELAD